MENITIIDSSKIKILFNWKGARQKDKDFPLIKMLKGERNIRKIKYVIDFYFLRIILWDEKIEISKEEGGYLLKDPYLSELMKDDNEPTEEELEAQRTDAAERKTHAKEVEGEELV